MYTWCGLSTANIVYVVCVVCTAWNGTTQCCHVWHVQVGIVTKYAQSWSQNVVFKFVEQWHSFKCRTIWCWSRVCDWWLISTTTRIWPQASQTDWQFSPYFALLSPTFLEFIGATPAGIHLVFWWWLMYPNKYFVYCPSTAAPKSGGTCNAVVEVLGYRLLLIMIFWICNFKPQMSADGIHNIPTAVNCVSVSNTSHMY